MAARHIERNYHEKITIDALSNIAEMSRSTFTSRFREFTGLSVSDFLLSVRLYHASSLMADKGRRTMDEIAESSGLYDHTNLVRVFKKTLGVTPREHANTRIKLRRINEAVQIGSGFDIANWIL